MPLPTLHNIDKSSWKKLPFGKIAQSIGERVDPTKTDLETYVGLEHIDAESIHIKRFGKREDVSGTKLRCYPGDIIFGRRRAYQRKAAICEFDGFCSAHALVLRAIPEVIDPKLFPFFLHSDQFMHRAVDISVGGLSPTINWTKLKTQEFLLPPKDQQAKLAELLWAADAAVQRNLSLKEKLFVQLRTTREHLIGMLDVERHSLQDLCKKKISYGIVQPGPNIPDGKPFIQSSDLSDEGVDVASLGRTTPEIYEKYIRSEVVAGDILFSLRGNLGEVQFVPDSLPKSNLARGVARVSTNGKVDSSYLIEAIRCERIQRRIRALCTGSTFKEITIAELRGLKVPVPESLETQAEIAKTVVTVRRTYRTAQAKCSASKEITKSLINQIF